jgi:hypothetical protein
VANHSYFSPDGADTDAALHLSGSIWRCLNPTTICDGFGRPAHGSSDTPGEVRERHEARSRRRNGAKLRVVRNPAVERQSVKERIRGHVSPLLCNDCGDLALVLGDDGGATEKELRSLHLQDVTPDEAREIDLRSAPSGTSCDFRVGGSTPVGPSEWPNDIRSLQPTFATKSARHERGRQLRRPYLFVREFFKNST